MVSAHLSLYLLCVSVRLCVLPCTVAAAQVLSEHNEWGKPNADPAAAQFHQEWTGRPKAQRAGSGRRQQREHQLRTGNGDRPHLQAPSGCIQAARGRLSAAGSCGHLQEARQSLRTEAVPRSRCTVKDSPISDYSWPQYYSLSSYGLHACYTVEFFYLV